MRTKLVIGNWKLNGNFAFNEQLLGALTLGIKTRSLATPQNIIAVCPPVIYLQQCNGLLGDSPIFLGGQDLSDEVSGAFTGEISGIMLKELGCRFVIVGHSERRIRYRESDELVAKKALLALDAGLTPIICLGETAQERNDNLMKEVVVRQLNVVMQLLKDKMQQVVIAYEPVWAIGTGITATSEQVQEVHHILRSQLKALSGQIAQAVAILYGGSVKADNAKELFSMPDVDGALVGGASLKAEEFLAICQARLN